MKEQKNIQINFWETDSWDALAEQDVSLLKHAVFASKGAYAPYSNFKVGASVLLEDNEIVVGSNQENIAYPSGLCAERVTLFSASANYPNVKIKTLAIYAESATNEDGQLSPCGSCRQVMQEYEAKQEDQIRVLLMNSDFKVWEFKSCADLLPLAFKFNPLKKLK